MLTDLYPVPNPLPGRLAVMPRPRGGDWLDDEVRAWRRAGVDVVVSLLEGDEAAELGLADEAAVCRSNGVRYVSFPLPDRGVPPDRAAFTGLVARVVGDLSDGKSVAVHCRQGIGRAGLVAVGVLIAAGFAPAAAVREVTAARGRPVPETPEQLRWIEASAPALAPIEVR